MTTRMNFADAALLTLVGGLPDNRNAAAYW